MNLGLAGGVIAGSVAATVALMLLVRRRAPVGGRFTDSDRAAGVLGVLGVGYAILLGIVILIAFESYSNTRTKAEDEATAVFEQFQAAALFAPGLRDALRGDLICYGRSVISSEWPAMRRGASSPLTETWIDRMEADAPGAAFTSMRTDEAYKEWAAQSQVRDEGRRERLLESQHPLPTVLWVLLILCAAVLVVYMLFFADSGEPALVQAMLMGGVTALLVASLLPVALLTSPYQNANGSIKPTSMRYSLELIDKEIAQEHDRTAPPCDLRGVPAALR
jgi:Protein of unknown function (DUF4239)